MDALAVMSDPPSNEAFLVQTVAATEVGENARWSFYRVALSCGCEYYAYVAAGEPAPPVGTLRTCHTQHDVRGAG